MFTVTILFISTHKISEDFYDNNKYKFAIMAIFRDEELYLEEWLEYHIDQGIEYFYLYSNDPDMSKYPYLEKYKNHVTIIPWIDVKTDETSTIQRKAYEHCIENFNNKYDYIMMLDIDEFLYPIHNDKSLKVIDIIKSYDIKTTKALKIPRFNFGSNGHVSRPTGKVAENYTKREKICSTYKTIANSSFLDTTSKFYGVHDFPFLDKPGTVYNSYFSYEYTGWPYGCIEGDINEVPLVINHYYTKSYQEYMKRCDMWESRKGNDNINPYGYRHECESKFKQNDHEYEGEFSYKLPHL